MDAYERIKADQINQPVHSRTILSKGKSYITYNGYDTDEIERSTNRRRNQLYYERETRKRLNTAFKTKIKTTLLRYLARSFTILLATQLSFVSSLNIPSNGLSNLTNKINTTTPTLHHLECRNNTVLTKDPVYFINHINFTKIFDGPIASRENIVQRTKRSVSSMSTGTFKTPTSSNRINILENEIRNVQSDITKLKTSSSINTEDRNRLATLEASLEMLQKLITDHKREQVQKTNSLESLVTLQTGAINNITNELSNIKSRAEEQQSAQIKKELPEKCILAIKSHDFASAEKILNEINDYSKINFIINAVYNHREGNFELVLKFGESLQYIQPSHYVYKALNYEMVTNDHKNPHKMIQLARSVREIINMRNTPQNIKTEASSLESNLKTSIKLVTKEKFKTALLNNNYQLNSEINQLSNEVYNYSNELFEYIYRDTVKEIYNRVNINTLMSSIRSHEYIGQCILGFYAVFDNMENFANTDSDSIFRLANYVKQLMEMDNFSNVASSRKAKLERIKNGLPTSVRNVVFSSAICIRNVVFGEYLYSPRYKFDDKRRHVFTWIPGGINSNQRRWKLVQKNGHYHIQNVEDAEFLFADFIQHDKDRRRVFTWIPGGVDSENVWQFERKGDDVHIKSVKNSEYLYAAGDFFNYDKDRRSVFTWIPGGPIINGVWRIEDCS